MRNNCQNKIDKQENISSTVARDIYVKGIIQGVGFRPFVFRLAHEEQLSGWVINDTKGVTLHVEGRIDNIDNFVIRLSKEAPPAAHIKDITIKNSDLKGYSDFKIEQSDSSDAKKTTYISPDLGTCAKCEQELFDPTNRRFRYPFINCTNCGPRFTILHTLPYDRKNTSMAKFVMDKKCQSEYDDPFDRRFHAQPNACFECGPQIGWILSSSLDTNNPKKSLDKIIYAQNTRLSSDEIFKKCVELLKNGGIVAIKGLGGYHLVCDANNPQAIEKLRKRKKRDAKPFAIMAPNIDFAKKYCYVSIEEEAYLSSSARPIVLLQKRPQILAHTLLTDELKSSEKKCNMKKGSLSFGLADGVSEIGIMLPATPVQMILAHDFNDILVMTSGNIHDDPICITEVEAFEKLGNVADAFLINNRDIVARYDDSVLRIIHLQDQPIIQFLRRARGYAPSVIPINSKNDSNILALGSEQKNTFTLVREGKEAFVSQHIGDVENASVLDAWDEALKRYETIFCIQPDIIRCDLHPDYILSKKYRMAINKSDKADQEQNIESINQKYKNVKLEEVQHHFAHILSVMGENNLKVPVIGFSFDGTGYGIDGAIWGGEVFASNYSAFERIANIAYFPLPGSSSAIKNPMRSAFGILWAYDLIDSPQSSLFLNCIDQDLVSVLFQQVEQGINCPMTSSMGRLFDGVSALIGICRSASYDGQPAIELETAVHKGLADGSIKSWLHSHPNDNKAYEFDLIKNVALKNSTAQDTSEIVMDPQPVIEAILDDIKRGVPQSVIAKRFHDSVVHLIVLVAQFCYATLNIKTICLTGGVFQNRYLLEHVVDALRDEGFAVALNVELPPNDGNISFGQAVLGFQS